MLRCNLAVLLAEQNLKITKVSADTGISRTTLTFLTNNYSQGIQFDTLNTLCMYLKVTPDKLISFVPVEVEILEIEKLGIGKDAEFDVSLSVTDGKRYDCNLRIQCDFKEEIEYGVPFFSVRGMRATLWDPDGYEGLDAANSKLIKILKELPRPFAHDLGNTIVKAIDEKIGGLGNFTDIGFSWDTVFFS